MPQPTNFDHLTHSWLKLHDPVSGQSGGCRCCCCCCRLRGKQAFRVCRKHGITASDDRLALPARKTTVVSLLRQLARVGRQPSSNRGQLCKPGWMHRWLCSLLACSRPGVHDVHSSTFSIRPRLPTSLLEQVQQAQPQPEW